MLGPQDDEARLVFVGNIPRRSRRHVHRCEVAAVAAKGPQAAHDLGEDVVLKAKLGPRWFAVLVTVGFVSSQYRSLSA